MRGRVKGLTKIRNVEKCGEQEVGASGEGGKGRGVGRLSWVKERGVGTSKKEGREGKSGPTALVEGAPRPKVPT